MKVALIGNPNSGKSTVFNQLTGMNTKVGNFPGVTVEKQTGFVKLDDTSKVELIDLPGLYSLYPNTEDERVSLEVLLDSKSKNYPEAVLFVASATQLDRQLLMLTQILDLGFPTLLIVNMMDEAKEKGIEINADSLAKSLNVKVVFVSGRTGENMANVAPALKQLLQNPPKSHSFRQLSVDDLSVVAMVSPIVGGDNAYRASLIAHHHEKLSFLSEVEKSNLSSVLGKSPLKRLDLQVREVMERHNILGAILSTSISKKVQGDSLSGKLDRILAHSWLGMFIYMAIMLVVFQSLYSWSSLPMYWIEEGIGAFSDWVKDVLPNAWFSSLLTDGIIAGLSGILVFIPQIFLLFLFITILEEVGYMSRAAYLFDGLLRRFGLNGRSLVGLISGGACAIPAIMSTRTINNSKERLISILVIPFISCSARIPVYTVLVAFVVPKSTVMGIFNSQALVFMALYLLGILAALLSALALKLVIRTKEDSFLMLELPPYRIPHWRNVLASIKNNVGAFVVNAGKIIMAISVVLWFLTNFGPTGSMDAAEKKARGLAISAQLDEKATESMAKAARVEASWAGLVGKGIEPAIAPLGFDWKIGIAIISSFAAREVFVGTMSTLYATGADEDDTHALSEKMKLLKDSNGRPFYTMPRALSLVVFYVLALQCMSTMAVVKRETNSWKWPILQFLFMGGLAYLSSWVVFNWLF